jgi:hypothetical protein
MVEELRRALLEFKERFDQHGLLQRHGHATPDQGACRPCDSGGGSLNFVQLSRNSEALQ